jgi:hypothetical protein
MTEDSEKTFWFPAKRYGWGWGPPTRWQGWVVLTLYVLLLALNAMIFLPSDNIAAFLGCAVALTIALMIVCWFTGERPRWRRRDE